MLSTFKQHYTEEFNCHESSEQDNLSDPGDSSTSNKVVFENTSSDENISFNVHRNRMFTSTPINLLQSTLMDNNSTNKAELSGKIGVSGASRMAGPIEVVATKLTEIKNLAKAGNNKLLLRISKDLETGFYNFTSVVEELIIKNSCSKTCHKNESKDSSEDCSSIYKIKRDLNRAKKVNVSLENENQVLSEQKDELEEKNKELLTTNNRLKKNLLQIKEEKAELSSLVTEKDKDLSKVVKENKLLKQKINELNTEYKNISRSEETKRDLGTQVGEIKTKTEYEYNSEATIYIEKLNLIKFYLAEKSKELSSVKQKVSNLEHELNDTQKRLTEETSQVAQLTEEKSQLEDKLISIQQSLDNKAEKLGSTETEVEKLQKELSVKTKELKSIEVQFAEQKEVINKLNDQITGLADTRDNLENILKNTKQNLEKTKAQLEEKNRELDDTKRNVLQLTDDLRQEQSSQQGKIDDLTREKDELLSKNSLLVKEKDLGLNNENKGFSTVSAESRKQVTYASVSFVLSVAFTVGAGLTIPYLAICIPLAVAAFISLATGCYYSYKANTALKNVEVDQVLKDREYVVSQGSF
ncbi:hypothetical protein [Wolbachia endosymbiont (group A) of Myopa testacea]|uniref:TomO hydrophobic C-terminal domain-containing protein n=1 Tax=Wolbachia endosymbiont (group A) of Myopa testacea TaxID=3066148 RepID=UPI00333FF883